MRLSTAHRLRDVSFFIARIISIFFTVALFRLFGRERWEQAAWMVFGFTLEIIKIYLFPYVKMLKRQGNATWGPLALFYAGIFVVSLVAAVGYSVVSVENQSFSATAKIEAQTVQYDTSQIDRDIASLEADLAVKMKTQESLNATTTRGVGVWTATQSLDKLNVEIQRIRDQISQKSEERRGMATSVAQIQADDKTTVAMDVFSLLGRPFHLPGKTVLIALMLFVVLLLELIPMACSDDIEEGERPSLIQRLRDAFNRRNWKPVKVEEEEKKVEDHVSIEKVDIEELTKYIDALIPEEGNRIPADDKISQATGIPLASCGKYREALRTLQYKNTPLIETRQGGTKTNFSKGDLMKIATFFVNTGRL